MRVGRVGLVAVAAVAVLASACGGVGNDDPGSDGGTGASGTTGIEHPTGADELILGVAYEGGFVAYGYTLGTTPFWSLFGDGTQVVPGPQVENRAPPCRTSQRRRSPRKASRRSCRPPRTPDSWTATRTCRHVHRRRRDHRLHDERARHDVGRLRVRARREPSLRHLRGRQGRRRPREARRHSRRSHGPPELVPAGSLGTERPYDPTEMRVDVLPYHGDTELPQEAIAWPLDAPLDGFGETVPNAPAATRCGVVTGEDLTTLLAAAKDANALTPWTSGGTEYQLIFRPLLPDEHTC